MTHGYATPYADVLPALSSAELEALRQRIADEGGIHDPVLVTEGGEVLDGHNRLAIDSSAPTKVISGSDRWTTAQKKAFVIRANRGRRNLSPDQDRDVERTSKSLALDLKREGKTQKQIARIFGVSRQRVGQWLAATKARGASNGCQTLDCRIQIPGEHKPLIFRRAEAGESHEQIAAEYKVTRQAITKVVNAERAFAERRRAWDAGAKKIAGDCGVICGEFPKCGDIVADESVDLIFTDPPYTKDKLHSFSDLGAFTKRVLRPGGWCLAYAPVCFLPQALNAMLEHLSWGWQFLALHTQGDARFHGLKLYHSYKPIFGFYRPPLAVTWNWFRDSVSGQRDKSLHEWQQAEDEAAYFVERFSSADGFVCDPFAGSGTTLAAAKALGRRYLGFEIDAKHVKTARVRLAGQGTSEPSEAPDLLGNSSAMRST